MNPEISRYLCDLVALFIRHYKLQQHEQQARLIERGAELILRSFKWNQDGLYDADAYKLELQVHVRLFAAYLYFSL
jgi:hypothetical protein